MGTRHAPPCHLREAPRSGVHDCSRRRSVARTFAGTAYGHNSQSIPNILLKASARSRTVRLTAGVCHRVRFIPGKGLAIMNNHKLKAIACTISRGGFSDERIFRLNAGGVDHEGLASRRHMWKADGSPIQEGEPPLGRTIKGFVAARLLELVDASTALVSLPDGETAKVPTSDLRDRPAAVGQHVPV